MNLFFKTFEHLSHSDIVEFCEQNLPESVRLEYKRALSSTHPEKQIIKCVSALANTQGGIVLFGVGTLPNSKYPDWPSDGMTHIQDFEKRVVRWCIEHIYPPVIPMVGYVMHPTRPDSAYAVLRVQQSSMGPHTTDNGTTIYVRRADNSDPVRATFAEIELLRNHRERSLRLEEEHIVDLRYRIGLSSPPTHRSNFLIISQKLGRDDAIPMTELQSVAEEIRSGAINKIGTLTSYSRGVFSAETPGWTFALTGRASLGVGFGHTQAGGPPEEKLNITSLANWAGATVSAAGVLARKSDFWGNCSIQYEAYNYEGIVVAGLTYERACVDPAIKVNIEVSSLLIREKPEEPYYEIIWRMLWSFGQGNIMPSRKVLDGMAEGYFSRAHL